MWWLCDKRWHIRVIACQKWGCWAMERVFQAHSYDLSTRLEIQNGCRRRKFQNTYADSFVNTSSKWAGRCLVSCMTLRSKAIPTFNIDLSNGTYRMTKWGKRKTINRSFGCSCCHCREIRHCLTCNVKTLMIWLYWKSKHTHTTNFVIMIQDEPTNSKNEYNHFQNIKKWKWI